MKTQMLLNAVIIIMLTVFFIGTKCNAHQFTNQSGPIKIGRFTNEGSYTVSFSITTNSGFHRHAAGVMLWEYGDNRLYIEYPNAIFVTTYIDSNDHNKKKEDFGVFELTGAWGYSKLNDHKPHKFTIRRSGTIKELLMDSVLIGSIAAKPQAGFTSDLVFSSDRKDMKLSGEVSGIAFTSKFVSYPIEVAMPDGVIDSIEYPLGYIPYSNDWSNVMGAAEQLESSVKPVFHGLSKIERNSLCIELKYMAGYDPGQFNNYQNINTNGKRIASALIDYNCGIRVCSNLNSFYSDYTRHNYCFDLAMIEVAKEHPDIRKDFGTAIAHCNPIGDIVPNDVSQADITTPLSFFKPNRDVIYLQGALLKSVLISYGLSVDSMFHFEDNEGMSWMEGGANGTAIYNRNINYLLDSMRSIFPNLKTTAYDIYSSWFWTDKGLHFPMNLEIANTGKGSISIYTVRQQFWNSSTSGEIRGARFMEKSVSVENAAGYNRTTVFTSPGWSKKVEDNLQPSTYSGLVGIEIVLGADMFFPAFFTTGSGNVQDPKSYAYIPTAAAFAQACVSDPKYWKIITQGELLRGDSIGPQWDYNLWSGDIQIKTVARKLGHEYLIATTHQKENAYVFAGKRKVEFPLILFGDTINIYAKPTATFWYYNARELKREGINPRYLSSQIYLGHFTRWETSYIKAMEEE